MPTNNSTGEVYYVNYPYYNVLEGVSSTPFNVGHAGVLTKDVNGNYGYYEYGVYDKNIYGTPHKNGNMSGNWRKIDVKGSNLESISQELFNAQGKAAGDKVTFTRVNADPEVVIKSINTNAYNPTRDKYTLCGPGVNNCGKQATTAINSGTNSSTNKQNKAMSTIKRVLTGPFAGIPEVLLGKGATSNLVLNGLTTVVAPHLIPYAQAASIFLGDNTTNDFENQYLGNETYTYTRKK